MENLQWVCRVTRECELQLDKAVELTTWTPQDLLEAENESRESITGDNLDGIFSCISRNRDSDPTVCRPFKNLIFEKVSTNEFDQSSHSRKLTIVLNASELKKKRKKRRKLLFKYFQLFLFKE